MHSRYLQIILAIAGSSFAASLAVCAPMSSTATLAKERNCLACHQITGQSMGPGLVQIARRYEGTPNAAAFLQKKIVAGGGGSWSPVPMPPNPQLTQIEAAELAQWILAK